MIIAQAKRKENMAEYLLYMWQVEDIIRAFNLDIDLIQANIIDRYGVDNETKAKIRDWYESLIKMMQLEDKKESGHLQINNNTIIRLTDLHLQLLDSHKFPRYEAIYYQTLPIIVELRAKTGSDEQTSEIETCFNALYGTLLLKLKGQEISPDTLLAVSQISQFLGTLSALYLKDEETPLFGNEEEY